MRRAYVDVSPFRSPYSSPNLQLTGLGAAVIPSMWPAGRAYFDVSRFRAPYQDGYFQNNQLFGLGTTVTTSEPGMDPATAAANIQRVLMLGALGLGVGAIAAVGLFVAKRAME